MSLLKVLGGWQKKLPNVLKRDENDPFQQNEEHTGLQVHV